MRVVSVNLLGGIVVAMIFGTICRQYAVIWLYDATIWQGFFLKRISEIDCKVQKIGKK